MLLLSAGWVDARLQARARLDYWPAVEAGRTPLFTATSYVWRGGFRRGNLSQHHKARTPGALNSSFGVYVRTQEADVPRITALFFVLVLLAATQDIAVDGWALTLLSRRHIGCAA